MGCCWAEVGFTMPDDMVDWGELGCCGEAGCICVNAYFPLSLPTVRVQSLSSASPSDVKSRLLLCVLQSGTPCCVSASLLAGNGLESGPRKGAER